MIRLVQVCAFTVFQALCSMLVALVIGVCAAFFTANRRFPGRQLLLSCVSVPLCVPALLVALGYVSFFGRAGTLNALCARLLVGRQVVPVSFLYSFSGIIIAQGFYNFPIVMSGVHDCWMQVPREQADAARLLGAGELRVFWTVTVRQLLPAMVSSCMLVFLYCYFSFMIVLMFGGAGCTTLEVEIYKAARFSLDYTGAAGLIVVETVLACAFVTLYALCEQDAAKSRGMTFVAGTQPCGVRTVRERVFAVVVFLLIAVFFAAPLFSILYNAFTDAHDTFTFAGLRRIISMKDFNGAVAATLATGAATAFFCVCLGFLYAAFVRTVDVRGRNLLLRVFPMLPMALSSVAVGVVVTMLVPRGNAVLLIAAQVLLFWPLAFRHIWTSLSKVDQDTVDAARLLSVRPLQIWRRIYLPAAAKGIISAAGFCFAVSAGDATLPLVMALPRFNTLALFTYRLAGSYRFHEGCAAGLLLGVLCMTVFAAARRLQRNGAGYHGK